MLHLLGDDQHHQHYSDYCFDRTFVGRYDESCLRMLGIPIGLVDSAGCGSMPKQLLITSMMGSGTMYVSELLTKVGAHAGHQAPGDTNPIVVSWFTRSNVISLMRLNASMREAMDAQLPHEQHGRMQHPAPWKRHERWLSHASYPTYGAPVAKPKYAGPSWTYYAPFKPSGAGSILETTPCLYRRVLVQIRHPLRTISSMRAFVSASGPISYNFVESDAMLRLGTTAIRPHELPDVRLINRSDEREVLLYLAHLWWAWFTASLAAADGWYRPSTALVPPRGPRRRGYLPLPFTAGIASRTSTRRWRRSAASRRSPAAQRRSAGTWRMPRLARPARVA